jgi:hypothetical protein
MYLNYETEESMFHAELSRLSRSGILFLEIDGKPLQPWLANRLISKSPVLRGAYRKYVEVSSLWKSDKEAVWQWIKGREAHLESSEEVLRKLSNELQDKTIFLTMCGMESLRGDDLEYILQKFWLPLQPMLEEVMPNGQRKCVLLLVGESGWTEGKNKNTCFEVKDAEKRKIICFKSENLQDLSTSLLPRWGSLTSNQLQYWFEGENVQSFCEQQSGKPYQSLCDLLEINPRAANEPIGPPYETINTICSHVLRTKRGIAELHPYKNLAS